jgi:diguanylate cyclase (GGDEF)-like protein
MGRYTRFVWISAIAIAFATAATVAYRLPQAGITHWYIFFSPVALCAFGFGVRGALAGGLISGLLLLVRAPVSLAGAEAPTAGSPPALAGVFGWALVLASAMTAGWLVERSRRSQSVLLDTAQRLAVTDGLTGLLNRRAFQDQLARACASAVQRPQRSAFALVVLDIHGFKQINDTLGHLAGDAVLQAVARALAASVRAGDLAFRYGGDEFAVLLCGVDTRQAREVAERLKAAAERAARSLDTTEPVGLPLRLSVGVAVAPEHGDDPNHLFTCADRAMYASKAAGSQQVVVWRQPSAEREFVRTRGRAHEQVRLA